MGSTLWQWCSNDADQLKPQQVGAACQLPGAEVAGDELAATLQDWLDEFERVQLLLRLSPRLRQKRGD